MNKFTVELFSFDNENKEMSLDTSEFLYNYRQGFRVASSKYQLIYSPSTFLAKLEQELLIIIRSEAFEISKELIGCFPYLERHSQDNNYNVFIPMKVDEDYLIYYYDCLDVEVYLRKDEDNLYEELLEDGILEKELLDLFFGKIIPEEYKLNKEK